MGVRRSGDRRPGADLVSRVLPGRLERFSSWSGPLERLTATPPARDRCQARGGCRRHPGSGTRVRASAAAIGWLRWPAASKDSHKHPGRGQGPTEEPDRQAERYEQDDVEAGVAKVEVLGERRQSDAPEIAPAWCRRPATVPPASGGIVAASAAPTLVRRRNAIQLSVRRRRATRPATASAITVVMASPGRNHGRTPARVLKGSPP